MGFGKENRLLHNSSRSSLLGSISDKLRLKFIKYTIFSPGGACTAGGSRSGVGESVSESVSESVANFLCLNDQAYNCLIHLRDYCTVTQCVQYMCTRSTNSAHNTVRSRTGILA